MSDWDDTAENTERELAACKMERRSLFEQLAACRQELAEARREIERMKELHPLTFHAVAHKLTITEVERDRLRAELEAKRLKWSSTRPAEDCQTVQIADVPVYLFRYFDGQLFYAGPVIIEA